jgi:hypothetical protein
MKYIRVRRIWYRIVTNVQVDFLVWAAGDNQYTYYSPSRIVACLLALGRWPNGKLELD